MKKRFIPLLLTIGLASSFSVFADHNDNDDHHANNAQHRQMKAYHGIDLSDSQKQQIKTIFSKLHNEGNIQKRKASRAAMVKLIHADTLDEGALQKLADQRGVMFTKWVVDFAKARHQAWKVLTPVQQAKVEKLMAERKQKRNHD